VENNLTDDLHEDGGDGNIGLAFGQGFFCRSATAEYENTNDIVVQAFLVHDFEGDNDMGVEIIPNAKRGTALIRIDQNMWDFIEDVAECEHEEMLFKGMVLGEMLVGTAHRMIAERTGQFPPFI
jgi:hypothetical protein